MKKTMSLKRPFISRRSLSLFLCATLVGTLLTSGFQNTNANAATTVISGQTYDAYTPLKDVYKDYFNMGIFGSGEMNASIYNFDTFTPGNSMKPESTQNVKGTFTYSTCDNLFNTYSALNPNINFYGHTLAWHSQTPSWMWDDSPALYGQPGTFDKATALANLNNHIDNVLGHFGGNLKGIDVANEAVQTSNPSDWKASLAPQGCWYSALGYEWVEDAFLEAAKVVDANGWDCKLRYNDFGLDSTTKAQTVYAMVKDINERYAGVRPNGKPLIEVIGMQAHYSSTTSIDNVESAIKLFATLPNVKVNITESDVGAPPVGSLTAVNETNQAVEWAKLFQIYKKYASGSANTTSNPKVIDQVDICGVRDIATSGWRAGEFALLFDSNGLAKQALLGVLDPDTFLTTHQYVDPNNGAAIAHLDGVYTYSAANGDSWTGANIILGNDATQWPWSTAGADGKVAFTPEKDARYRLTLNYTSAGTSAIRVRWVKDGTNSGYTTADSSASNLAANTYSSSQVATTIPAYFKTGMVAAGSYTLTDEFKLDSTQIANGLIGNIAIRGGAGGNAYTINWIKVEKIGTGVPDTLLVNWPTLAAPTTTAATVAAGITSVVAPVKDATSLTMPIVPTDYTIAIKSVTTGSAISLNGTITPPTADTIVAVIFTVTKTADSTTADTVSMNVVVPAKTVDKVALTTAIYNATTLIGSKTVGTAAGNVTQIAKDIFQSAITTASAINVNAAATQVQVDNQVALLATATTNFNNAVIVDKNPNVLISELMNSIKAMKLEQGTEDSLISKLNNVITSILKGDKYSSVNKLNAFINEVSAQKGKKITAEQASVMIQAANNIIAKINSATIFGVPSKPVLASDNGQSTGLKGGTYNITMNLWWGTNGTQYKLYEDGVLIDTKTLTPNSSNAQTAITMISGKQNGTYKYYCQLINDYGITNSDTISVNVTDALPGKAVLSNDNWDGDGNYKINMNMWWGTNGTKYKLYENGVLIETQTLSLNTQQSQVAVTSITGRRLGTYNYYCELINDAGVTASSTMTVKVTK